MTETQVLLIAFIAVFGFGGYKLSGFVKKMLDDYSTKIKDKILESERLKKDAVLAYDEVNEKMKNIEKTIEKMNTEQKQKIEEIKKKFDADLKKSIENMVKANKSRMEIDREDIVEKIRDSLQLLVVKSIKKYSSQTKTADLLQDDIFDKIDTKKMFE